MTISKCTRQLGPIPFRMMLVLAFHRVMNMNEGWAPKAMLAGEYTAKNVHRFKAELFPEVDVITSAIRFTVQHYRLSIPADMIKFDWADLDDYIDDDLKPFYLATKQILMMKQRR